MGVRKTNGLSEAVTGPAQLESDDHVPSVRPHVSEESHSVPLGRSLACSVLNSRQSPVVGESRHTRLEAAGGCPFHGFEWPADTPRLRRVAGNRCGLALDRVDPCGMEEAGREVDMLACPLAKKLSYFIRASLPVMAFVIPDHPQGMSYAEWSHYRIFHNFKST